MHWSFLVLLAAGLSDPGFALAVVASDFESTLLQVSVITRHGDRTPTRVFPRSKSIWPEGLGQLTEVGMKQHYDLGRKLRERYVNDLSFLSPTYNRTEFYVRSTGMDRTLMSAHAFTAGFFPRQPSEHLPLSHHPVPIYSADRKNDTLLHAYKSCPRLRTLQKEVRLSRGWREEEARHTELLSHLSDQLGEQIALADLTTVANLLHAEQIHNRSKIDSLSHPDLPAELQEIAKFVFRRKFATQEMGRLGIGKLVEQVADHFFQRVLHRSNPRLYRDFPRFHLYSAHDGTLLALLSALNLHDLDIPHYAANFVFELHQRRINNDDTHLSSSSSVAERFSQEDFDLSHLHALQAEEEDTPERDADLHFVRLYYNDEKVTLQGCPQACPLQQFLSIVQTAISENWHADCQVK